MTEENSFYSTSPTAYRFSKKQNIVSRVAYLIGVPRRIFEMNLNHRALRSTRNLIETDRRVLYGTCVF